MAERPRISAEATREVISECGHRCAVCGQSVALEMAHIIPWTTSRDHSSENLICLCANCHHRADSEKWGTETLRHYKENPWVVRARPKDDAAPTEARVEIRIKADFADVNEATLRYALAAFLDISPEDVSIESREQG